jgi:DNA (cytosine-5)-methyltransferase 1
MKAIDLFSGAGCGSAGVRHAGFKMVGAIDSWDVAAETYQDNFTTAKVVTKRLNRRSGPELLGELGKIDLLVASPECNHHSCARGNRPRDEESRRSGWYMMNFIKHLEPRWIILENVAHMRSWDGFNELVAALKRSYHVRVEALNAIDFGVPQNRRRLFIIGDKRAEPKIPNPTNRVTRTASSILAPVGTFPAEPVYNGKRARNTIARVERGIDELGRCRDFLIVYYGQDWTGWQPLDQPLRTLTTLDRFGLVQWIDRIPTLRMLQIPELKRAMGLARLRDERGNAIEFVMNHGTRKDKVKLLGNGVCAPVMKAVVGALVGG